MDARIVTKKVVRTVVTLSTSFTVSNVLSANTPATKPYQKAEVIIGSFVLGSLVADKAGDYTDRKVDEFFDWYEATFTKTATEQ